jgi:hypothetical protein
MLSCPFSLSVSRGGRANGWVLGSRKLPFFFSELSLVGGQLTCWRLRVCELLPPRLCVAVGPLQVGSASAAYLHSFELFFLLAADEFSFF